MVTRAPGNTCFVYATKADKMQRALDSTNTDVAAPSEPGSDSALESAGGAPVGGPSAAGGSRRANPHTLCPFCATVNEGSTGACRQCGMENSAATRQATRGKIGPWFVLQPRNLSAPGMNWATLIALVNKGRVTPRSIVRGPTTGQLWRYAARVKGLSREFGLCWHCGMEIRHAARLCPTCKRMQQPPINPDVLLESDPLPAPQPGALDPRRGLLSLVPEPVRREVSNGARPPLAQPAARAPQNELPADVIAKGPVQMIDMGEEPAPAGVELRAFQLPRNPLAGHRSPRGLLRRIVVAAICGMIAMAIGLYLSPQVRPHYVRWLQAAKARVSGSDQRQAQNVDHAGSAPSSTTNPPASAQRASDQLTKPSALMNVTHSETTDASRAAIKPQTRPSTADISFGPGKFTSEPLLTLKDSAAADAGLKPATNPSIIAQIQITPPPMDTQTAERRAWELYDRAIKAEQREDYRGAVKEYEGIDELHLADGAGPSDVQSRLERARHFLEQREK